MSTRERVVGIDEHFIYTKVIDTHSSEEYRDDKHPIDTFDDKLFLRPMSSMTEKEKNEYAMFFRAFSCSMYERESVERIDWLQAHHFDYRGLIEKGLALEASKDMYK